MGSLPPKLQECMAESRVAGQTRIRGADREDAKADLYRKVSPRSWLQNDPASFCQRTKEALAAAKARGVRPGNPNLATLNRDCGRRARAFAAKVGPTLEAYRGQGLSQRKMVDALNECGVPSPRGGRWHAQTLTRVLKRIRRSTSSGNGGKQTRGQS